MGFARNLSHVRVLGAGDPGWGQTRVWGMAGATPSVSVYDAASGVRDSGLHVSVDDGVETTRNARPLREPSTSRRARVGAVRSSLPAAATFQGYFAPSFSWMAWAQPNMTPRPLVQNWNPNQAGSKELHPATVYNPFPAGGDLYPKVV